MGRAETLGCAEGGGQAPTGVVVKCCPPPSTPPSLGEIVVLVAGLGGYLGRKHDGPPGPKAMWIGLQRQRDFAIALEAQEFIAMRSV